MIFGIDVHPQFQSGLSIEEVSQEGFKFIATKLCEGTDGSYCDVMGSRAWISRAKACGLMPIGYHYLHASNEDAQAKVFALHQLHCGVPGMLDVEAGSGSVGNVWAFIDACKKYGGSIDLVYMPHWYWQQVGSPNLIGLPPLWASGYVAGAGTATQLYAKVGQASWNGYGNGNVAVLQFTDSATVAGMTLDADAYQGTASEFAALIGVGSPTVSRRSRRRNEENTMLLPAAPTRIDMQIPTDVVGGWCGNANLLLTANTGGATVYAVMGVTDRGSTPPLVTTLLTNNAGQQFVQWWPMKVPLAAGTTSVVVNYTAPAGMVAHVEYQN
jgi:hypothetical protein